MIHYTLDYNIQPRIISNTVLVKISVIDPNMRSEVMYRTKYTDRYNIYRIVETYIITTVYHQMQILSNEVD